jgi:hypothetical protein
MRPPPVGLPPQGALGKFGAVELSDVAAFVPLPSGKVLSGSEGGALLLWDGGLIQAVITRASGAPCHAGGVEALLLDEATGLLVSGGGDGTLRLWDAAALDMEPPEAAGGGGGGGGGLAVLAVEVAPRAEVALPPGARARGLLALDRRTWLAVDDAGGGIVRVAVPPNPLDAAAYAVARVLPCAAGGLAGLVALPDCHVAVVAGGDGSVRALDYLGGATLQAAAFGAPATCLALLPDADAGPACVAVGFADGCVRRLQRCSDGWALLGAARPHRCRVVALALGRGGRRAAAVAAEGGVFFFDTPAPERWVPAACCRLPCGAAAPTCADWAADGDHLLVGCSSGVVFEVAAPPPAGSADTSRCVAGCG